MHVDSLYVFICSGYSQPADGNIVDTMQLIVKESKQVETLSRQVAKVCTEPGLKKVCIRNRIIN